MEKKSLYEDGIALQFKQAKVRVKYEPYKMEYYVKAKGGFCLDCGKNDIWVKRYYVPDWVSEDDQLIVESKGKFTSAMRTKMLAVRQSNPDKDIRMLFMRDNWLTRKKQQKYSEWAEKHGIPYAIGEMPKEWIKEFKQHQLQGIAKQAKKGKSERKKSKGIAETASGK
jgi:hypothetical protein